jgi:hypothetical protein
MTELSPNDASVSDNHDTVSKESLLLLCTENAVRLFSLSHAIQVFAFLIIYHFFFYMTCSCSYGIKLHSGNKEDN